MSCCSWIFHRDCLFSRPALLALLRALVPLTLRVKGVFRVSPKTWVAVSAAPTPAAAAAAAASADVELAEIAYRRDSRVEVIVDVATAAAANADGQEVSSGAAEPGVAQRVAGALRQAAAGDWTALEELLVAAQATPA